VEYL